MTFSEIRSSAAMAFATVLEHKTRSFLTVLGVIIGTGAVIAVGSIITGVNDVMTELVSAMGPETILSFQFNLSFRGAISPEEMKRKPFTWEQSQELEERCPSIRHVSPYLLTPNVFGPGGWTDHVKYHGRDLFQVTFAGTEEGYAAGENQVMRKGRFFTDQENRRHQPVVVVGENVDKALFQGEDPIGKWIEVDGHQLQIVGVIGQKLSFPGQPDQRILVPFFTMHKMFPTANEIMFIIFAKKGLIDRAMDETEVALRMMRKDPPNKADDFWLSTGSQMLQDFHRITSTVALLMVGLSSIGLLVGGIGVMNIMLVSVTERTREIGIRKAVGAKRSDIVVQFLTEAVVLTGLGGLAGMTLGWLISVMFRLIFPSLPTSVPLWAAALGVCVSVGVGLFFGTWPALKAARLDPVVALQYE